MHSVLSSGKQTQRPPSNRAFKFGQVVYRSFCPSALLWVWETDPGSTCYSQKPIFNTDSRCCLNSVVTDFFLVFCLDFLLGDYCVWVPRLDTATTVSKGKPDNLNIQHKIQVFAFWCIFTYLYEGEIHVRVWKKNIWSCCGLDKLWKFNSCDTVEVKSVPPAYLLRCP